MCFTSELGIHVLFFQTQSSSRNVSYAIISLNSSFNHFLLSPWLISPPPIHKFQCRSLRTFSGVQEGFRTQPRLYYLLKWSSDYLLNETLMGCHCPLCHQKYKASWHTCREPLLHLICQMANSNYKAPLISTSILISEMLTVRRYVSKNKKIQQFCSTCMLNPMQTLGSMLSHDKGSSRLLILKDLIVTTLSTLV